MDESTNQAPEMSNGTTATVETTLTPEAAEKPKSKTAACRQLISEGFAETSAIMHAAHQRWGIEVTSTDVGNARADLKRNEEKARADRKAKRDAKKGAIPPITGPVTLSIPAEDCYDAIDAICGSIGIGGVRKIVDQIEAAAKVKLGI